MQLSYIETGARRVVTEIGCVTLQSQTLPDVCSSAAREHSNMYNSVRAQPTAPLRAMFGACSVLDWARGRSADGPTPWALNL